MYKWMAVRDGFTTDAIFYIQSNAVTKSACSLAIPFVVHDWNILELYLSYITVSSFHKEL